MDSETNEPVSPQVLVADKTTLHSGKKKRLSRTEQKARKKQKNKQHQASTAPSDPLKEEGTKESTPVTTSVIETASAPPPPNFDETYIPTEIPPPSKEPTQNLKSLGKWFPKAVIVKSTLDKAPLPKNDSRKAALVLFYQYVSPAWSEARVDHLTTYLTHIFQKRCLGGRVRVAPEGINATISSLDDKGVDSLETLHHFANDLRRMDPIAFQETQFKFIPNLDANRHFVDLKILPVKELVFYGLEEGQAPLGKRGKHLSPQEFHDMLANKDHEKETVVIDVRNHYEAAIGRFDGQQQQQQQQDSPESESEQVTNVNGAEYIDPKMRKSTDFATWINTPETQEKLKDKHVLLYCTGGVRCERASAHVNMKLGSQIKGVYQLQGGVENYLQQFPDGGFWRGKNYVFDKREAMDVHNSNGDGGVIQKTKTKAAAAMETTCCVCNEPWDRYIGKKKCDTCGVPVLMCDACMATHKKNKKKKQDDVSKDQVPVLVKCPLCQEQGVTVRADEVEYTNNGVGTVKDAKGGKAAPSVLKWGGGHAHKKKEKAHEKKEKQRFSKSPCRFGADCGRKDCFFAHPGRKMITPDDK
jgi:predicted sulfurtransferase